MTVQTTVRRRGGASVRHASVGVSRQSTGSASSMHRGRGSSAALLGQARTVLDEAVRTTDVQERFRLAHLAALRIAAAVVADRGRPASMRKRLMSVWVLLDRVAPEYAGWSACFVAAAPIRAAIEAGARPVATQRAADDLVRATGEFLQIVERSVGMLAA